jgi:hypothetical protein
VPSCSASCAAAKRPLRCRRPSSALGTLTLALISQVLVDATDLSGAAEWIARTGVALAALLIPGGFFLSVIGPGTTQPNALVRMIPVGAIVLAIGFATLGVGLLAAA